MAVAEANSMFRRWRRYCVDKLHFRIRKVGAFGKICCSAAIRSREFRAVLKVKSQRHGREVASNGLARAVTNHWVGEHNGRYMYVTDLLGAGR